MNREIIHYGTSYYIIGGQQMALSNEEIERLHRQGKIPDWVYYQTNNKSP